ncbi:helix-turn-helix domain-containing protein [Eubacteriaceae bacterium ES3]|nr:helix-turn-helix domain-containing protein [Eubacteriaceae bacterium ES3]
MEKLNLKEHEISLSSPYQSTFSDVRLLDINQNCLESNYLYIGENIDDCSFIIEPGSGLCLINTSIQFDCDTLYITANITLIDLFNKILYLIAELRSQFADLTKAILQKKELQQIVEILSVICGNPVYLVDSSFKVLGIYGPEIMSEMSATWRHLLKDGYIPYNVVMNLIESNELQTMESGYCADLIVSKYFYTPFINYNIRYKGKLQGHFFVVGMFKTITPGDIELTNMAAPYILNALRLDSSFQETRGRYYEHFIIDMINGKSMDLQHIKNQLNALHLDLDGFYTVVVIKPNTPDELFNEQIARHMESFNSSKPVQYNNTIITLFPSHSQSHTILLESLQLFSENLDGFIGVSDTIQGFIHIHLLYTQATTAILLGNQIDPTKKILCYPVYAVIHPFLTFSTKPELESLCHPGVQKLKHHDELQQTNFVQTLETFLRNERHSQMTASALHIHRNTLSYRLEKLNDLYPFNLDDHKERERILMTLNIYYFLEKAAFKS